MIDLKDIQLVYDPIITQSAEGQIFVKGQPLDGNDKIALKLSLSAYEENYARKVIKYQLKWLAINQGIHQCTSDEQQVFAKAALWLINEEEKLISTLK